MSINLVIDQDDKNNTKYVTDSKMINVISKYLTAVPHNDVNFEIYVSFFNFIFN